MKIVLDREEIESIVIDWCQRQLSGKKALVEKWESYERPSGIEMEITEAGQTNKKEDLYGGLEED